MLLDAILKPHDKIMEEPLGANAKRREFHDYQPRKLVASSARYTKEGKKAAHAASEA